MKFAAFIPHNHSTQASAEAERKEAEGFLFVPWRVRLASNAELELTSGKLKNIYIFSSYAILTCVTYPD